jgi:dephospho-CoA kinase
VTVIVGLTGNIASGKSTVARLLAARGATIIDADALAREVVEPGSPALAQIGERWPAALRPDGTLDRPALRAIVFASPTDRARLDAITHPEVARRAARLIDEARARADRVVVYDIPLLFEAKRTADVDVIVVVDAPVAVRRERLVSGRGLTSRDANAMIAAQMPAEPKRAAADHVIDNDGDRAALEAQVDRLWRTLASPEPPG